jgi:hypothetical protein
MEQASSTRNFGKFRSFAAIRLTSAKCLPSCWSLIAQLQELHLPWRRGSASHTLHYNGANLVPSSLSGLQPLPRTSSPVSLRGVDRVGN